MIVVNGVVLPDLPAGVFDTYPFALIGQVTPAGGTTEYLLVVIPSEAVAIPKDLLGLSYDMVGCLESGYAYYSATEAASAWTAQGEDASGQFSSPVGTSSTTVYGLLWSNHDILTVTDVDADGNPVMGGVYFAASEIQAEKKYWSPESWYIQLANITRKMAGVGEKLTRQNILYWLGRVIYIPQGHAYGSYQVTVEPYASAASGKNPVYQVRKVDDEPTLLGSLKFTSTARAVEEEA